MEELSGKQDRLLSGARPSADDRFMFGGRRFTPEEVVRALEPFLTEDRLSRIDEVLEGRTYGVATVVEGLVNLGNVSAVMRSAEALGFQSFHVITGEASFKNSQRTSQGAEKWLDVHRWDHPAACVSHLRRNGYFVIAAHLDPSARPIGEFDFSRKSALVFGNERDGISAETAGLADALCILPMTGFVRSFNISVAAALSLYHAYLDRTSRLGRHGDLSDEQRRVLRALFCLRSLRHAPRILTRAALGT